MKIASFIALITISALAGCARPMPAASPVGQTAVTSGTMCSAELAARGGCETDDATELSYATP
jgi:hypothetical protein